MDYFFTNHPRIDIQSVRSTDCIPAVVGNTISKSLLEYLTTPSLSAVTNAKTKKSCMAYFLTSNQCLVGLKKKEYSMQPATEDKESKREGK